MAVPSISFELIDLRERELVVVGLSRVNVFCFDKNYVATCTSVSKVAYFHSEASSRS